MRNREAWMAEAVPVLDYAEPGVPMPAVSRLIREEMEGGGVRFVEPAVGWGGVMGNVLACAGGVVFAVVLAGVVIADLASGGRMAGAWRLSVPVLIGALAWVPWKEARLRATRPTVIEASRAGGLRVGRPVLIGPELVWSVGDLVSVSAGAGVPTLRGERVSTLMILPRGQSMPVRLLVNRDLREVRWVAHEVRRGLGLAEVVG